MKFYKNEYLKTLFLVCLASLMSITMSGQTIFKDVSNQIPQTDPIGTDTFDSDLVDVDGDGDLDIFIAEGTAGIEGRANRLLLNDGNGNFTDVSQSNLPVSPIQINSVSVDFADVDNDSDMDIVIGNLGPTQLLLNNGNGIYTDVSRTLLPPPPSNIFADISTEIGFEDVNNDGRLDIFVTNEIPPIPDIGPGGAQNFLYVQKPDGTFADESLIRLPNVKNQTGSFVFGDIDSDGDRDLIIANVGQNQVLINDGSGFFINETDSRISQQITASRAMVLEDIDCDTDLDLIIANSNQEQNQVFINDSNGFFQENTTNALPIQKDTTSDMKVFDFNYDGHPDIIFANSVPNPLGPVAGGHPLAPAPNVIYLNDGTGGFTDESSEFLPENNSISFDIEIADVNGDRLDDILISNANDGEEQLYLRDRTPATRFGKIFPFTTCVVDNQDGTFTATFGYANFNKTSVYIPEGSRNKLIPPQIDVISDQPVIFLQGIKKEAFTTTFNRKVIWKVNRRRTFANKWTRRCDDDNDRNDIETSNFSSSNYPNPFSSTATITYTLPETNHTEIILYNESGKTIKTFTHRFADKGTHEMVIDANTLHLEQGIYYYKINSGKHSIVKSFVFMK